MPLYLGIVTLYNDSFLQPLSGNWADIVEAHEQSLTEDVSCRTHVCCRELLSCHVHFTV